MASNNSGPGPYNHGMACRRRGPKITRTVSATREERPSFKFANFSTVHTPPGRLPQRPLTVPGGPGDRTRKIPAAGVQPFSVYCRSAAPRSSRRAVHW
eukprot:749586-Hanusia_phi.AAC.2